jgi:hypothetical protein
MAWVPPQQGFGSYATFQNFHHFRDTTSFGLMHH